MTTPEDVSQITDQEKFKQKTEVFIEYLRGRQAEAIAKIEELFAVAIADENLDQKKKTDLYFSLQKTVNNMKAEDIEEMNKVCR
jgi:hypothetical protein